MRRAGTALLAAIAFAVIPLSLDAQASSPHVLRFADGQDATHLNPLLMTTYAEAYPAVLTGAYLTRLGHRGEVLPELARDIPSRANGGISGDGKTIVFHLRPNLRFSDGSPLTAGDVVFTAGVITGKDTPVAATAGWDEIAAVDSPRAGDVRFRLRKPYSPAISTYFNSNNGYAILPERLLRGKDIRTADFNRLPVGAGPFRYAAYVPGSKVVMEANPFYFRGRPKLDRIEYVFIPDQETVVTQVLTGEIDLAMRVQPTQLQRLQGSSAISLVRTPSAYTGYIGFQTQRAPFDDPRVRLALRYATDRKRLLATVYHGLGTVSDDVVTPLDPFFGGGVATSAYDPKRAMALLESAGWRAGPDGVRRRNGIPLSVDFVNLTGTPIAATILELVRAQWAAVGITVTSRTLNTDVVFAPGGIALRGDFGAILFGEEITSDTLDSTYNCAAIPPHGFNYPRYCNSRVDALIAKANTDYDRSDRARLYLTARRLIAADAPSIPTIHREDLYALRTNVSGFRPAGLTTFDDVMDLDVR